MIFLFSLCKLGKKIGIVLANEMQMEATLIISPWKHLVVEIQLSHGFFHFDLGKAHIDEKLS